MPNEDKKKKLELIKKYLPQSLWDKAMKYYIPLNFIEKKPFLIELILTSISLSTDEEKQSWFNLLPLMTPEQIKRLEDILTNERKKLEEINKKYEVKKQQIEQKYIQRWEKMGYRVEKIKQVEQQEKQKDIQEAESLLNNL